MEMSSALVGPNISHHYISITIAPLNFKCNYICHNLSGFTALGLNVGALTTSWKIFCLTCKLVTKVLLPSIEREFSLIEIKLKMKELY